MKNKNQPATYEDLTPADVKQCKGFETVSDKLAQAIADAIRIYTEIIYSCFTEGKFSADKATVKLLKQHDKKAA